MNFHIVKTYLISYTNVEDLVVYQFLEDTRDNRSTSNATGKVITENFRLSKELQTYFLNKNTNTTLK